MKKDFKKVVVLAAMAGIMAITPIMSADAAGWVSEGDLRITDYETPARERLRASFPSITDAHFYIILGNAVQDGHDGWGEIELDSYWEYQNRWASLSPEEKESWAYLCALSQEDRDWLRNNHYSTLADCDRTWCVNGGADAVELDALIAKVTESSNDNNNNDNTNKPTTSTPVASPSVASPSVPSRGKGSTRASNSSSGSSSAAVSNNKVNGNSSTLIGSWKRDANGWWFQTTGGGNVKNRWGVLNGKWYYFDNDGYMKTGWIQYNGTWYYCNPDPNNGIEGEMKTGWIMDHGTWYYLGKTGAMAVNTWIDSYYVGADGAWQQNKTK